ncbi:MAG TPA: hypothetical protein VLX59_11175 [Acidimicrobiales bacterium]|nr:hypothetical protein [Acidimicrobiales bacterium]
MVDIELLYRQQLTSSDLALLRDAVGPDVQVTEALGSAAAEEAVFGGRRQAGVAVGVSPFLAFATAVHRTSARLETVSFVEERWGRRVRIPLFDVAALRDLVSDQLRRWFLVELLASYTRVSSGVTWTRTARGWRRRRFSELDPASLAEQLEVVGRTERPGVYRRLGDLALFLLGVFPDHLPELAGATGDRLLRVSGVRSVGWAELDGQDLLEHLGSRWYRAAVVSASSNGYPVTAPLAVAGYIGEHFGDARRVVNAVTDRYLFPVREQWFGG